VITRPRASQNPVSQSVTVPDHDIWYRVVPADAVRVCDNAVTIGNKRNAVLFFEKELIKKRRLQSTPNRRYFSKAYIVNCVVCC
jgi:hypothetical protein